MPDVIVMPDGRTRTIFDEMAIVTLVREYAGDEIAEAVRQWKDIKDNTEYETEYRAQTDLDNYEAQLEHLQRFLDDIRTDIYSIIHCVEAPRINKNKVIKHLRDCVKSIENEY